MRPICIRRGFAIVLFLLLFAFIDTPTTSAHTIITGIFYRDSFTNNLPILIDCYQENLYLLDVDNLESDSYYRIDDAYVEPLNPPIETELGKVSYRIASWIRILEIGGCFDRGFNDDAYESDPLITGYLDWGEFTDTIPILQNCDDGTLYYFHPPGYGRNYFNIYDAIVRPLEPPEELGIGTISYMIESFSSIEPIGYVENCGRSVQTDPPTEPSAMQTQSQQISGNDQLITIPPTKTRIPPTPLPTDPFIYDGPLPNDGYESGPTAPNLLERIIQIFVPPVEASYSPTDCKNRFKKDNCTYFVAEKRPDVCEWITPGMGHAYQWTSQAQQNGNPLDINVNSKPHIGDIVVWEPGCAKATEYGHAAMVKSIDIKSNTFRVREANWSRIDPDIKVESCMSFIGAPIPSTTITTIPVSTPNPVIVPTPSGQPSNIFQWIIDLFKP